MKKRLAKYVIITAALAVSAQAGSTVLAEDVKEAEIVLEAENAPYTYEDENGEPAGYEYEVLKLIDDYLEDWSFNYQVLDYETALAGTTNGKYDLDSGCKFRTPAREEAFLVSEPYNYFFMNLVVKADSEVETLEDMSGKSIASIVGTDGRAVALNDWMTNHPDVEIDFEPLAASGAMADEITGVEDGVYDAAYLSREQAEAILEETGYDDLKITDRVDGRDTAFLINKDKEELQAAVNEAIKALTDDGTLGALTKEFFGEDNFAVAEELGLK
ncbi:MAG: transporter substrate-binding domain-containing protein [Eubacteriales bacterium]|nr:transporter substrate-binding domain-containing protein [Eubacteriales bacterium]